MTCIKNIITIAMLVFGAAIAKDVFAENKVVVIPLIENAPQSDGKTIYVKSNGQNIGVFVDDPFKIDEIAGF